MFLHALFVLLCFLSPRLTSELPPEPLQPLCVTNRSFSAHIIALVAPSPEFRECKDQGRCQDPPPSERGGAAMNGMSMHGRRKAAGAATGGVLRAAIAASTTPHRQRTNQEFCGWTQWTHASTASRSTPPAALSICSEGPIPLEILPPGGTPLSEGGRMLARTPCPEYGPIVPDPSSRSTGISEEPVSFMVNGMVENRWKTQCSP